MSDIPHLLGTTLSGRSYGIPGDLPPAPIALIFGFSHDARHDVAAWKAFFSSHGIAFLSLPTTPMDLPVEALATTAAAMKAHVPEQAWDSIIQMHSGGAALLEAFHWSPDSQAKVLLVEGTKILAQHGHGPWSEAAGSSFLTPVG